MIKHNVHYGRIKKRFNWTNLVYPIIYLTLWSLLIYATITYHLPPLDKFIAAGLIIGGMGCLVRRGIRVN